MDADAEAAAAAAKIATRFPGEETDRTRLGTASSAIFNFSAWLMGT